MSRNWKSLFRRVAILNVFAVLFVTIFSIQAFAEQRTIKAYKDVYVSPDGSDLTGKGKKDSPFQTLAKARDEVRAYMGDPANTPPNKEGDIIVYLRGGTYYLDDTLTFGPEDSGQNGYNVIYKAYPGETPVISGGTPITGWQLVSDGLYKASVGSLDFRQLYINDTRGVRARTRRNFEVRASNDPTFATYTVLGSQGDVSLPYKSTWYVYVLNEGNYRYIRYVKPVNFAAVAELRVLAQ